MSAKKEFSKSLCEKVKRLVAANAVLRAEIIELKKELAAMHEVSVNLQKSKQ